MYKRFAILQFLRNLKFVRILLNLFVYCLALTLIPGWSVHKFAMSNFLLCYPYITFLGPFHKVLFTLQYFLLPFLQQCILSILLTKTTAVLEMKTHFVVIRCVGYIFWQLFLQQLYLLFIFTVLFIIDNNLLGLMCEVDDVHVATMLCNICTLHTTQMWNRDKFLISYLYIIALIVFCIEKCFVMCIFGDEWESLRRSLMSPTVLLSSGALCVLLMVHVLMPRSLLQWSQ